MTADTGETIRQITRLARSGALERAWSSLESCGLAAADADARALALRARLEKDRARQASGSERVRWLERSAADYLRAAKIDGASYPLINAATLSLLAGRHEQARGLARQVLDLLEANPDEAETPYWLGATRAEALLLLGKLPEARAALRAAVAEAPCAWEDWAATLGQFALIGEELACDLAWLDRFRPPRSAQYTGIMEVGQHAAITARIADWLETENVGFGFGALAAGADILIAEALVARGARLHVILPCPIEIFRERSVAAVDPAWLPRFDHLLEAAETVDALDTAPAPSPAAVRLTDAVSLGLAMHNARLLQSEALRLRIASKGEGQATSDPEPVRAVSFAFARQSGVRGFEVGEAGVAKAMLRAAGNTQVFGSPSEAWAAARTWKGAGTPVALDYRFIGDGSTDDELARLDAVAEVSEPGQILATKAMAFALLAEAPQVRVETIGEIRGATGFFPVYALA